MIKQFFISVFLLTLTLLTFDALADDTIAIIGDKVLTEDDFQTYATSRIGVRPGANLPEDKRRELMEELVNRELIYQSSLKEGFDKNPNIQKQIEEQVRNVITGLRIRQLLADTPISDDELKKVYEQQIAATSSKEYHARHILLDSKEKAISLINELNKGADFVELAKKHSTGPSAAQGGDLGWFALNQMVKPFADAVEQLKPGAYTKRAVQTRYGWHLIKLEESRDITPPSFHSMQEQLTKVVQNQIIADYLDKLREDVKVEIK